VFEREGMQIYIFGTDS